MLWLLQQHVILGSNNRRRFLYIRLRGLSTEFHIYVTFVFITLKRFTLLNYFRNEICGSKLRLCPHSDHDEKDTELSSLCSHSKLTYVFDNYFTLWFAVIMSFWCKI